MIRVTRAPAYSTIQDAGRRGFMASGVPRSGAMDPAALATLNTILGNDAYAAAIEWALTGGSINFESETSFAFGGAETSVTLNGSSVAAWQVHIANPGDSLLIGAPAGRFVYVAVSGGVEVPVVMGARGTYLPGAFGGLEGRRLESGDAVATGTPADLRRLPTAAALPADLRPPLAQDTLRYIPRGDASLPSNWRISAASDRTGYRLEGSAIVAGGSVTSEPVCPGAIQIPPDGSPIVLMADAPTVGGYRIAGALITVDLGVLAQSAPGAQIVLKVTDLTTARHLLDNEAARLAKVREWSRSLT